MLEELVERIRRIDRQAGGDEIPIPIGPIYFARDYIHEKKRYPQGGRAVVLGVHKFLGQLTHMDLRLPDGDPLLGVPIDYIRTLD
jgi:hypothetical protein